jgi:hypothetical protein
MNDVFVNFLRKNKLTTRDGALNARADLQFETGSVELKSAWKVVRATSLPPDYFVTKALLPRLKTTQDGHLVEDKTAPPREATVALVAIHVVFALPGHPELVWSTFEHIDSNGQPDTAPVAPSNPPIVDDPVVAQKDYLLYKSGTSFSKTNQPASPNEQLQSFDESSQTFTKAGKKLQTSTCRVFPASKSLTTDPDDEVVSINTSMRQLFETQGMNPSLDKRCFYQLVGAIWLDNPTRDFIEKKSFHNNPGQSPDDVGAVVAGEDGLSSTAMESFTQFSRQNCFSCHDTQRVLSDTDGSKILDPKRLNVSHIMSRFLLDHK